MRKSKRVISGLISLALVMQIATPVFADVVVITDNIISNTGNYVSDDSELFKTATEEDMRAMIEAWGIGSSPKFSVVEGDYNYITYNTDGSSSDSGSEETTKRILTWSVPEVDNLDTLGIKSKYWLNPYSFYGNYSETELLVAYDEIRNYLWGTGSDSSSLGKTGELYSILQEYTDIVDSLEADFKTVYSVFSGISSVDLANTLQYLETFATEMQVYGDLMASDSAATSYLYDPFYSFKFIYEAGKSDFIDSYVASGDLNVKHQNWVDELGTEDFELMTNSALVIQEYDYIYLSDLLDVFCNAYANAVSKMSNSYTIIDDYNSLVKNSSVTSTSDDGTVTARDYTFNDFVNSEMETMTLDEFTNAVYALIDTFNEIDELNDFYTDSTNTFVLDYFNSGWDAFSVENLNISMYDLFHSKGEFHIYDNKSTTESTSSSSSSGTTSGSGSTSVSVSSSDSTEDSKLTDEQKAAAELAAERAKYTTTQSKGTSSKKGSESTETYVDEYGITQSLSSFPSYSTFSGATIDFPAAYLGKIYYWIIKSISVSVSLNKDSSGVVTSASTSQHTSYSSTYQRINSNAIKATTLTAPTTGSQMSSTGLGGRSTSIEAQGYGYFKGSSVLDCTYIINPPATLVRAFVFLSKVELNSADRSSRSNAISTDTPTSSTDDTTGLTDGLDDDLTNIPDVDISDVVVDDSENTTSKSINWYILNERVNFLSWYNEDGTYKSDSPIELYNQHIANVINTINSYTDAKRVIVATCFEDSYNISTLWDMVDLSTYTESLDVKEQMLQGSWDFNGSYEMVQKQIAELAKGVYADGTEYAYTMYTPATTEDGSKQYYAAQFEVTPWITYDLLTGDTTGLYSSDYVRNESGKTASETGNPIHPSTHTVNESDILTIEDLGYADSGLTVDYSAFKLKSVDVNVECVGFTAAATLQGNSSVYALTLTGDDMYNIDLTKIVETIKEKEFSTVPDSAIADLKEACNNLGYTSEEYADVLAAYYSIATGWNSDCGFQITLNYNYELKITHTTIGDTFSISDLSDTTMYVIPEYSLSEYYDSVGDSFTSNDIIKAFKNDADFGAVADSLTLSTETQSEPIIASYCGATAVSWYSQLHRVGINNLYNNGTLESGSIKTDSLKASTISIPDENLTSDGSAIPGTYLYCDGNQYAIIGYSNGKVSYDTRYFVLTCDTVTNENAYTVGSKEVTLDPTDPQYIDYRSYIREIAKTFQPVTGGVTSVTDVIAGSIGTYATSLDASILPNSSEGVLVFTPVVGNTKVFYAVQEASGKTSTTQTVRRVARMLYPITQYTVSTEDYYNTEYNLNNHLYAVYGTATIDSNNEIIGTDVVQGNNKEGVNVGALRAFVTEACVPKLIWDSNGNIKNTYNDRLATSFDLDIYLWLSKSSAEDGIYVADWINETPTVFNTTDGSLFRSTNTTIPNQENGQYTSIFKNSHIAYAKQVSSTGEECTLKRSIILQTTPTEGTFSDWVFGKTTGRSAMTYWCASCHEFTNNVRNHAFDWAQIVYMTTTTTQTTYVHVSNCCGDTHEDEAASISTSSSTINVPTVMCDGNFYKVGFWDMDYLDASKAEYITLADGVYEWQLQKTYVRPSGGGSSGSGVGWNTNSSGLVNVTGLNHSSSSGGTSSTTGYSGLVDATTIDKEAKEEWEASKAAILAEIATVQAQNPEATLVTVDYPEFTLYYFDNIKVGGTLEYWGTASSYSRNTYWDTVESDTRMGYADSLTEQAGIYHYLPTYRLGSESNPLLVDNYGTYTASKYGASSDIWAMFDSGFSSTQKNAASKTTTTSAFDSAEFHTYDVDGQLDYQEFYQSLHDTYNDYSATMNRGGVELYNTEYVSGYAYYTGNYSTTRYSATTYFSMDDLSKLSNWNNSYHNTASISHSLSGNGVALSTTPYTPPEGSITFNVDISIPSMNFSVGSFGSNTSTTEQLTSDGTYVITTTYTTGGGSGPNGAHIHTTTVYMVLTQKVSISGTGIGPYLEQITAAEQVATIQEVGTFALNAVEGDPALTSSMVGQTVDGSYWERSGVLVSEDAGSYWYTDPTGEAHYVNDSNTHTIEIWTDNVTYYPMTFVKNIRAETATPVSNTYKQANTATRVTKKITAADGDDLSDHTWQTDIHDYTFGSLDTQRTYTIVPEVLMTYKTDFVGYTTSANTYNRGQLKSLYIAAYNSYEMTFPAYHNVKVNYAISNVNAEASAVAKSTNANELSKHRENLPVWYSGTDATVTYISDAENNHIEWNSYVLDFVDSSVNGKNVGLAWNADYSSDDAVKLAEAYLDSFKDTTTEGSNFVVTGIMTNSYATLDKDDGGDNDIIANATNKDIVIENDFEFATTDGTNTYIELDSLPITIRNARLAAITVDGVEYYFPTEIDGTSEALAATTEFVEFNTLYPDIAEALINMELEEFASTWVHNGGSESWDKYAGLYIGSGNTGTDRVSISDFVSSIKKETSKDFNVSNNWYAEDSTVLRIRVFKQEATLPDNLMFTWKIPVDYGYKAPTNKSDTFKYSSSEVGLYGYCELGLRFKNTWHSTLEGEDDLNSAGWDIMGNEYTATSKVSVDPLFVIHNGNVNDMYS